MDHRRAAREMPADAEVPISSAARGVGEREARGHAAPALWRPERNDVAADATRADREVSRQGSDIAVRLNDESLLGGENDVARLRLVVFECAANERACAREHDCQQSRVKHAVDEVDAWGLPLLVHVGLR
jgi:hypothetical protein